MLAPPVNCDDPALRETRSEAKVRSKPNVMPAPPVNCDESTCIAQDPKRNESEEQGSRNFKPPLTKTMPKRNSATNPSANEASPSRVYQHDYT